MLSFVLLASFSQDDFSSKLTFTSGSFSGYEHGEPVSVDMSSQEKDQVLKFPGETFSFGNLGKLYKSGTTRCFISPSGKVEWAYSNFFSRSVIAMSSNHFVVAEKVFYGGFNAESRTAELYEAASGKPLYRWFFHELKGNWPGSYPYGKAQTLGTDFSFGIYRFRVQAGFVPSLGTSASMTAQLLESYLATWAHQRGVPVAEEFSSAAGTTAITTQFPQSLRGPYEKETALLASFRRFAGKFEEARKELGHITSLKGVELSDYSEASSEREMLRLLDTQGSQNEIRELLMERYQLGVKALAKDMQAVISGPLIPKSGTVSKAFNPNTAYLVRQAMRASSLTEIQKRRVNACWLFDLMKTDIGNYVQ